MVIETHTHREALDSTKQNVLVATILYDTITKQIVNFCVLLLFKTKDGAIHEVIKFDFSHSCYNVHRYYLGHSMRQEKRDIIISPDLFREVKKDVRQNWQGYTLTYCMRHLPQELLDKH